jgi:acetyl-CoA C-acetyltransferase
MSEDIYIVSARRTPIGSFQGALSALTAPQLGAVAARAAIKDSGIDAAQIDETIFGCVLMAGIGQAPGRQAALAAGVPPRAAHRSHVLRRSAEPVRRQHDGVLR